MKVTNAVQKPSEFAVSRLINAIKTTIENIRVEMSIGALLKSFATIIIIIIVAIITKLLIDSRQKERIP